MAAVARHGSACFRRGGARAVVDGLRKFGQPSSFQVLRGAVPNRGPVAPRTRRRRGGVLGGGKSIRTNSNPRRAQANAWQRACRFRTSTPGGRFDRRPSVACRDAQRPQQTTGSVRGPGLLPATRLATRTHCAHDRETRFSLTATSGCWSGAAADHSFVLAPVSSWGPVGQPGAGLKDVLQVAVVAWLAFPLAVATG